MQPKQSIAQVKSLLASVESLEDPLLEELAADPRKGVQAEIAKWHRKQEKIQLLEKHRQTMLQFEETLIAEGYQAVAGVDEVGRGPLAGPVVAAAVILPLDMPALPINDSKQLSLKQRNELYDIILEKAEVGVGLVDNHVIDSVNIYQATKLAMQKAVASLPNQPDALLIDAMKLPIDVKQVSLIKGDARSYSIAAASIVAKVYRDRLMADYAVTYPHYGFENNAGYGTKVHLEGLEQHGITPIHRHSFEPIKTIVKK